MDDFIEPSSSITPPGELNQVVDWRFLEFCKGARVFYFVRDEMNEGNALLCDHSSHHNPLWQQYYCQLPNKYVEVGTLTDFCFQTETGGSVPLEEALLTHVNPIFDLSLRVVWDCGTEKTYSYGRKEWEAVHALDFAPAGLTTF